MKSPTTHSGYVLLSVVAALAVLASVTLMLGRNAGMTVAISAASTDQHAAQLAAESALALMQWQLSRDNCSGYTNIAGATFPPGSGTTVSASVVPDNGAPVDLVMTATTATGSKHSIHRSGEPVYKWPLNSLTIAPDAIAGKDAMIADGFDDTNNYGAKTKLELSNDLIQQRALLQFDFSGVPAGADIVSATLTLDMDTVLLGSNITITAHRMTVAWEEGTGSGGITDDGVDWHEYTDSDHWVTHGGDFDAAIAASTVVPDPPFGYDKLVLQISDLVRDWVAGIYPNYGLLLQGSAPLTALSFYSSDHSNATRHPILEIRWRCLCSAAC